MQASTSATRRRNRAQPELFVCSPHFSDQINHSIVQSEIEGGVSLDDLSVGSLLEVETRNRFYTLEYRGDGAALICGHPTFCPQSVLVSVHGSTWGGSMLKTRFIGRGMRLEFRHPSHGVIRTSTIQDVRESLPRAA